MMCTMPGRLTPEGFVRPDDHRTETPWFRRQRPSDAEAGLEEQGFVEFAVIEARDGQWRFHFHAEPST
ncbi:MAG: hypothetical protein EA416_02770 [Trueperaceae bacterium]|nr:MAG: hypothetical protein EA416_02770 [Trueperaceae bacterium]